jgi:hypothetical protein
MARTMRVKKAPMDAARIDPKKKRAANQAARFTFKILTAD